ncbi:MAG: chitinase [Bacteroidota bacterium]|nr:chitinase [Bacteroidota bacterium]
MKCSFISYTIVLFLVALLCSVYGYGQKRSIQTNTIPLKELLHKQKKKTNLLKYLTATKWNELFPNRNGANTRNKANNHLDFYSFTSFVAAANLFPDFLGEGTDSVKRRELAAFLANIAQETSGGWDDAPGGYFKWGLYFIDEHQEGSIKNYADTTKKNYMPIAGKAYFGRGPKQLSWNYNYGQFSEAWYGNKDSLLQQPELLSQNPVLSFASAIWFWMKMQKPKPSCHDIMVGRWQPSDADSIGNRLPGFGATVNVINGGVECGKGKDLQKTAYRYQYYVYFCKYLHVSPGNNITCTEQKPFGT